MFSSLSLGGNILFYLDIATCRSMPTSAALDVVAKHLNLKFFEVVCGSFFDLFIFISIFSLIFNFQITYMLFKMQGTYWLEIFW